MTPLIQQYVARHIISNDAPNNERGGKMPAEKMVEEKITLLSLYSFPEKKKNPTLS